VSTTRGKAKRSRCSGVHSKRLRTWCLVLVASAATVCLCLLTAGRIAARHPEVSALDLELDGPGRNVDDPCFWVDPADSANSLLFVTTKDSGLVEVFNVVTGKFVTAISGFGLPNNCAVHEDLLLTTDRRPGENGAGPGAVKVHQIPSFSLLRTFGEDMEAPHGIDVLEEAGRSPRVYVTDSADASVHVYDLRSGNCLRTFSTGFGRGIEPILADDHHRRLYIARGENEAIRSIGLFEPDGKLVREFGSDVFSKDVEGMAIYACGEGGYLVAADQHKDKTQFEVFDRVTLRHLGTFRLRDGGGEFTSATDGIEILQTVMPGFPSGVLAACDGCGSNRPDEMDVVSWDRIAGVMGLESCPGGLAPQ
jgi:3-phytase